MGLFESARKLAFIYQEISNENWIGGNELPSDLDPLNVNYQEKLGSLHHQNKIV